MRTLAWLFAPMLVALTACGAEAPPADVGVQGDRETLERFAQIEAGAASTEGFFAPISILESIDPLALPPEPITFLVEPGFLPLAEQLADAFILDGYGGMIEVVASQDGAFEYLGCSDPGALLIYVTTDRPADPKRCEAVARPVTALTLGQHDIALVSALTEPGAISINDLSDLSEHLVGSRSLLDAIQTVQTATPVESDFATIRLVANSSARLGVINAVNLSAARDAGLQALTVEGRSPGGDRYPLGRTVYLAMRTETLANPSAGAFARYLAGNAALIAFSAQTTGQQATRALEEESLARKDSTELE